MAPSSKPATASLLPNVVPSCNSYRSASPNSLNIADALYQLKRGKEEDDDRHFQSIASSAESGNDDPVVAG